MPDLVILDLMLPEIDGLEVCRLLKRDQRTAAIPVIMLTAKGEEIDRIVGLELGADDYIAKPFSPREVVLRVRVVLRRIASRTKEPSNQLEVHGLTINLDKHMVRSAEGEIDLTATEFKNADTVCTGAWPCVHQKCINGRDMGTGLLWS